MTLPPLREELSIQEGPRGPDGQPGWILHDPARHQFFRLDWLTFEILQRWTLREPALITQQIQQQTLLRPESADVDVVLKFLADNQLLHLAGAPTSAGMLKQQRQRRQTGWRWLVHHYLFFRVPLVRPEPVLRWLDRRLGWWVQPWFWCITALALFVGVGLVARQWDEFVATGAGLIHAGGLVHLLIVLVGVKVIHEFGHGLAATHYGCRVPTMGIAFLVLTPIPYTDVNDAWNLHARAPRLWIGAAGMLAELMLAAWATLAWVLLPDGALRDSAFLVATVTWLKSLLVNISPVMRFDGYYLLSDALNLPNLHARAFALARWRLRESLFDLDEPPPEQFRPSLERGLIAFAWFVWIYRLIVFLGIAIFVYHFFFKALGVVLFAVELLWFVILPVFSEFKQWASRRRSIFRRRRLRYVLGVVAVALLVAAWPLPQRLRLAGALSPQQEYRILTPASAQLLTLPVADGMPVTAGQILGELASPELEQRVTRARAREAAIAVELDAASVDPMQRPRWGTLQAALATAQAARREAEAAEALLRPVAPFDGVFRLADNDLQPGQWLSRQEPLATVVAPAVWQVTGYVSEAVLHLVQAGATARFFPDGAAEKTIDLVLATVERDAARTLPHPVLATMYGGSVPAHVVDLDLVPEQAVYRVTFRAALPPAELGLQVRRGQVVVVTDREAALTRWTRRAAALLWREAGF